MNATTYSAARSNLASIMEKVCQDHDPVIITKKRDSAVVMISLEDYNSMLETAYILKSPENAKRIINSLAAISGNNLIKKTLKELKDAVN